MSWKASIKTSRWESSVVDCFELSEALQFKLQHWAWIRRHSGCESIVSLVFPVCLDCMRHSMCSVVQPVLSSCMENLIAVIKVIYSSGNSLRRYMFQSTAAEDLLEHRQETTAESTKKVHLEVTSVSSWGCSFRLRIFFYFNHSPWDAFDFFSLSTLCCC